MIVWRRMLSLKVFRVAITVALVLCAYSLVTLVGWLAYSISHFRMGRFGYDGCICSDCLAHGQAPAIFRMLLRISVAPDKLPIFGGWYDHFVVVWLLGIAAVLFVVAMLLKGRPPIRMFRPVPGHCAQCGYAIHGLPTPICPECGTTIESQPPPGR